LQKVFERLELYIQKIRVVDYFFNRGEINSTVTIFLCQGA
jgi:hypothetical protein